MLCCVYIDLLCLWISARHRFQQAYVKHTIVWDDQATASWNSIEWSLERLHIKSTQGMKSEKKMSPLHWKSQKLSWVIHKCQKTVDNLIKVLIPFKIIHSGWIIPSYINLQSANFYQPNGKCAPHSYVEMKDWLK